MALTTSWQILVATKTGTKEIVSPAYKSEDDATAELKKIIAGAKDGTWIELDWLGIDGRDVSSAHTRKRTTGSTVARLA